MELLTRLVFSLIKLSLLHVSKMEIFSKQTKEQGWGSEIIIIFLFRQYIVETY